MSGGYRWDPVFRVVPRNGPERFYWLADLLTDARGPTSVGLRYVPDEDVRTDVNRALRAEVYGLRPEVEIGCQILSMADQSTLAEIESALMTPRACDVFLSLDGGVVYRRVVRGTSADPAPLAGKTFIGAAFRLGVRAVDLIDERPSMSVDPGLGAELVQDGGFEQWPGGASQSWIVASSPTPNLVHISQEATVVRSGASSAKVLRDDGTTFADLLQGAGAYLHPLQGRWYRLRVSARATVDLAAGASGPLRIQVNNAQRAEFILKDGKSVASGTGEFITPIGIAAATWTDFEGYFRVPATWSPSHDVLTRFLGYWTAGESLYYDDVSVYGPVLRPGYATW